MELSYKKEHSSKGLPPLVWHEGLKGIHLGSMPHAVPFCHSPARKPHPWKLLCSKWMHFSDVWLSIKLPRFLLELELILLVFTPWDFILLFIVGSLIHGICLCCHGYASQKIATERWPLSILCHQGIKTSFLFSIWRLLFFSVKDLPPVPELDFGLWARASQRFSPPLSPRSFFPTVNGFSPPLSPRSFFPNWSAVFHPKSRDLHVTSGSGDVTSIFKTSGWAHDPYRSVILVARGNPTTNQKPKASTNQKPRIKTRPILLSGPTLLLITIVY